MSGLIVALRTDGGPIAPGLIERLTAPLAVRGPDALATWRGEDAALGWARLQVGTQHDVQPLTVDGERWIVADARIDDRRAVAKALGIRTEVTSDAEMILRAFLKWGETCVNHLIGDFAFAIWDRRSRRLFCARDHLGVRPLYYVSARSWLLVSSSVNSLRCHSAVSAALDDRAVSDFLLFGHNAGPSATTFRDIRRLPPAHSLRWSSGDGCCVRRYWELPMEEPVYRKDEECAAEFRDLLDTAIVDRLRGQRVGVMFSGGLDSATIAARARRNCASEGVRAFSFTRESIPSDADRQYAAAAATHLGIRCDFYEADSSDGAAVRDFGFTPEPIVQPVAPRAQRRYLRDMAAHSRVAFSGEGPDNALLYEWSGYVRHLWRRGALGQIACDAITFLRHHRRLPLWPTILRRRTTPPADSCSPIPPWMPADLVQRLELDDRWRDVMRPPHSRHPVRPAASFSLQMPLWQTMHNEWDPCYTGVGLELCHPFLDLRVLRFLLSVPVIPWCRDKHLLRYAFRGDLPRSVRVRPKTPLPQSLDLASIRRGGVPPIVRSDRLEEYASLSADKPLTVDDAASAESTVRLATFSHWLAHLDSQNAATAPD